ncbi:tartrate dehydrogenase [Pseudomonas syringae pv. coryli]|uniref:Tartrate dehydrogenase n=1 Tax=Pseudomonas syringae pv. coryli TaxID=317659 RepID=A0A0P9SP31_9PSED|nr:tartrate dehydrogenase [Pseudomonas syringae pv. coryli]
MKRQRSPQHFRQIGGNDRQLCQQPLALGDLAAVAGGGQLRQVTAGRDTQPRTKVLQDHAREAGQHHHEQQ